jgi:hypothetical protein
MFNNFMLSEPFVKGKMYTCIYNDQRAFTVGKEYKCLEFSGKFDTKLMKDQSSVKFMSDEGNVNTLFGSIAVGCFTNDPVKIKEKFISQKSSWREHTLRSFLDFSGKLETALRELDTLISYQEYTNKYTKLLGEDVERTPDYEDKQLLLDLIKKYNDSYVPTDPVLKFIDSPAGLKLLREYTLNDIGNWTVYTNGVTNYYSGTLQCVLDKVANHAEFKGEIRKINLEELC